MPGRADVIDQTVAIEGANLHVSTSGDSGPAVLLLHGFPQTHLTWRHVAPALADSFQLVCPDLPGYGASDPPSGADDPAAYAKRRTAETMVKLMHHLGHHRFAVIGHDRGALVALRAGLDHPDAVTHVGALDIIPTVDNWAALSGVAGVFAFHLYLLAQPTDLPERLIGADPGTFFGHFLDTWVKQPGAIGADVRAAYLASCRHPEVIHAICQDYRASAFVDAEHDAADQNAGRRLTMPTLAMWQDPGGTPLPFNPPQIWQSWANVLRTEVLPCGHFLPEEQPDLVAAAIRDLLAG